MTAFFRQCGRLFRSVGNYTTQDTNAPKRWPISRHESAFGVRTHTTFGDFNLSLQKTEEKIWQYLKS